MFESDAKKDLRSKYNKMTSISAATGKGKHKLPAGVAMADVGTMPGAAMFKQKSVYGELKLSEQLANELNMVRDQVYCLKESLEESNYLRDQYKREKDALQADLDRKNRENRLLKQQIKDMNTRNKQTNINYEYMISTSNSLITFVGTSEHYRKKFSEKLRAALQQNDDLNNQLFEFAQNKQLNQISYEIVHKKLHMLYESINAISNAKNLEDKYQFEITQQKELIDDLRNEKTSLEHEHREMFKLKDQFADECKELSDAKHKIEKQMFLYTVNSKENISKLQSKLAKTNMDLEDKVNELMKFEKTCTDLK